MGSKLRQGPVEIICLPCHQMENSKPGFLRSSEKKNHILPPSPGNFLYSHFLTSPPQEGFLSKDHIIQGSALSMLSLQHLPQYVKGPLVFKHGKLHSTEQIWFPRSMQVSVRFITRIWPRATEVHVNVSESQCSITMTDYWVLSAMGKAGVVGNCNRPFCYQA